MTLNNRQSLSSAKRIVVKIGTRALSTPRHRLSAAVVRDLARQIAELNASSRECLLVSSGAIGSGMGEMQMNQKPKDLSRLQALASIGQARLMRAYAEAFRPHGLHVGQILLTREDFEDRSRFLNARNAITAMLKMGAIPIINENDATAVDELAPGADMFTIGDNDQLSVMVSSMMAADLLIILSDVPGLYTAPPHKKSAGLRQPKIVDTVENMDEAIQDLAYTSTSRGGKGRGMQSKLEAAHLATAMGKAVVLACAKQKHILKRILQGHKAGTLFLPNKKRLSGRKQWLTLTMRLKGHIRIDNGAVAALVQQGKSLLPSGILNVREHFSKGDLVAIEDTRGVEIGRGLVNYSSKEIHILKGRKTSAIRKLLGAAPYQEIIHCDNMVMATCST